MRNAGAGIFIRSGFSIPSEHGGEENQMSVQLYTFTRNNLYPDPEAEQMYHSVPKALIKSESLRTVSNQEVRLL